MRGTFCYTLINCVLICTRALVHNRSSTFRDWIIYHTFLFRSKWQMNFTSQSICLIWKSDNGLFDLSCGRAYKVFNLPEIWNFFKVESCSSSMSCVLSIIPFLGQTFNPGTCITIDSRDCFVPGENTVLPFSHYICYCSHHLYPNLLVPSLLFPNVLFGNAPTPHLASFFHHLVLNKVKLFDMNRSVCIILGYPNTIS